MSDRNKVYALDVGGLITSDTTWSLADSPVNVVLSTIVSEGVTLTIDPGVVVQVGENTTLQIDGQLIARGTSSSMITFTSIPDPNGTPTTWGQIRFTSTASTAVYDANGNYLSGSIFQFCNVENAGVSAGTKLDAILCESTAPYFTNCTLQDNQDDAVTFNNIDNTINLVVRFIDNKVQNNKGHVWVNKMENAFITGNTFTNNKTSGQGGALLLKSITGVTVTNNTITGNSGTEGGGIFLHTVDIVTLSNNTITENRSTANGGGIYFFIVNAITCTDNIISNNFLGASGDFGGGMYFRSIDILTITNNTITNNVSPKGGGIGYIIDGGTITIANNIITGNSGGGIYITVGSVTLINNTITENSTSFNGGAIDISSTNATISGNIIAKNGADKEGGAIYTNSGIIEITGNEISSNLTSFATSGALSIAGKTVVNRNNILNNNGLALANRDKVGSVNKDATNNWWGTTDTIAIRADILDFFTDSSKGIVDIDPIATGPVTIGVDVTTPIPTQEPIQTSIPPVPTSTPIIPVQTPFPTTSQQVTVEPVRFVFEMDSSCDRPGIDCARITFASQNTSGGLARIIDIQGELEVPDLGITFTVGPLTTSSIRDQVVAILGDFNSTDVDEQEILASEIDRLFDLELGIPTYFLNPGESVESRPCCGRTARFGLVEAKEISNIAAGQRAIFRFRYLDEFGNRYNPTLGTWDAENEFILSPGVSFITFPASGFEQTPFPTSTPFIPVQTPFPTPTPFIPVQTPFPFPTSTAVIPVPTSTPLCLAPVADFIASSVQGKIPLTVNFTDISDGTPTEWLWDFGDGGQSISKNPTHKYELIGQYTVSLRVTNACGEDEEVKTDFINALPIKSFTFKCGKEFIIGARELETLVMELGLNEQCKLKLTNLEAGVLVDVDTLIRSGLRSTIRVEPSRSTTDSNGELEITITAVNTGIDWVAWSVRNEEGEFEYSKDAYDGGTAWGMFVEVK